MKLRNLLPDSPVETSAAELDVADVVFDSRETKAGGLFFAIPGVKDDGARFAVDAVSRGAIAVVSESPCPAGFASVPWIRVADARKALSAAACAFFGNPSHHMRVAAVTGTNGKTTIAGLVRDCLECAGMKCGLLSTVENSFGEFREEALRTTPDPVSVQRFLAKMLDCGCVAASMEASSHALSQSRTHGIRFVTAGFTNLSRDHFDYHRDFEDYFAAKTLLFRQLGAESPGARGIVNADDQFGRRLIGLLPSFGVTPVSYTIDGQGDIVARDVELGASGTSFTLCTPNGEARIATSLLGRYNVSNMLCAAGMALASGATFDAVCRTFSSAAPRWGRLEKVGERKGAAVFVDYAHTPDAIEKVLVALREITRNRLVIVFGCGGDRDRAKRPQMAAMAARLADFTILTSDNPRTEDPEAILDEAETGFGSARTPGVNYLRIADRREAIRRAIAMAGQGDCVVIAGKGHENYQEIRGIKHHFDDREVVKECICDEQ